MNDDAERCLTAREGESTSIAPVDPNVSLRPFAAPPDRDLRSHRPFSDTPAQLPSRHAPYPAVLLLLLAVLAFIPRVRAQVVVRSDEHLGRDRPEAWAMNYVGATTLMTSYGIPPNLPAWRAGIALDLAHIPRLTAQQERVGLGGVKQEDLNKTEVFGRLRLFLGLPAGLVGEIGYAPPVSIGGAQPLDLFSVAIGRSLLARDGFDVSVRALAQHGRVHGDITCPAAIAGTADPRRNPFGCQAPSDDHVVLGYYGVELVSAWAAPSWRAHASFGTVRTEFAVDVDALTFDVRDRSRLVARGWLQYVTIGASHDLAQRWTLSGELLYVPLQVQREPGGPRENDPLASVRIELLRRFD